MKFLRRRILIVSMSALAALAACGTPGAVVNPSIEGRAIVRTADGLHAVSVASGQVEVVVPEGIASRDFGVLVSTVDDGPWTIATRLDPTGKELTRTSIAGNLRARVVSGSGRLVALTDPSASGDTPYLPAPKAQTRVVVMDRTGGHRDYLLDGNFEPEAFKVNDRELFMIEYIPALAPERYRVRRLRLGRGDVVPIGRLKGLAPDQMNGTGRTQVPAPDGEELYTLYTQQTEPGHAGGHHSVAAHAFVHLLNLRDAWAHCIDLPEAFAKGDPDSSALAVDPSGDRLYVIESAAGVIASVNPRRVRVVDAAELELTPSVTTAAAADGERVFVNETGGLAVIDGKTLEITDRWAVDGTITSLRMSAEGRHLYVSTPDELIVLDVDTGERIHSVVVEGAIALEHVR